MTLVELPLQRPRVALFTFFGLALLGALFAWELPRQEDPDLVYRKADVVTVFPGASPRTVERLISKPLEERARAIANVVSVRSESREGISVLRVEQAPGVDFARGWERLRDVVAEVAPTLPPEARAPVVLDELNATVTQLVALVDTQDEASGAGDAEDAGDYGRSTTRSLARLERLADDLGESLRALPEVAKVELLGAPDEEIQVLLDLERLSKFRVDPARVFDALAARNVRLPTGSVNLEDRKLAVEPSGELSSLETIAQTIVDADEAGHAIAIRDVAHVQRGLADARVLGRLGGERAIFLAVEMRKGAQIAAASEAVAAVLARAGQGLPKGVRAVLVFDQADGVRERFESLGSSMVQGMALVTLVLSLFLGVRLALVAALSIPLSFVLAFVPLGLLGTPLHQISLTGFIVALGLLVDNAIVVIENVADHLAEGEETRPFDAVLEAVREVRWPLIASTLTTIAAFLPLMLMTGDTGTFIRDLPLTVMLALGASLLVALGVVPVIAYLATRGLDPKARHAARPSFSDAVFARLTAVILRLRRRRWLVATGAVALTVVGAAHVPKVGLQLFPKADQPLLVVRLELPAGAPVERTDLAAARAARVLADLPETLHVAVLAGSAVPHVYYNLNYEYAASHVAQILWVGDRAKVSPRVLERLAWELRRSLQEAVPEAQVAVRELEQGPLTPAPVVLELRGDDVARLRAEARSLVERIRLLPGVAEVRDSYGADGFELKVDLDLDKANRLGVTRLDVAETFAVLLSGAAATTIDDQDEERPVVVRLPEADRRRVEAIEQIYVHSPFTGEKVPLRQLATLTTGNALARTERRDERYAIEVLAWPEGRLASALLADARRLATEEPPLSGVELDYRGEDEELRLSFRALGIASIYAVILISLILVAQFNAFTQPLVILSVTPPALAAAVLGLWWTGTNLGFTALIGAVSLLGILVNDAIVLVEFIGGARARGRRLEDAVDEGTTRRVKPILSTTLTTIGGLLPLALSGSTLWAPLCWVVIFGLGAATAITLLVLPLVYELVDGVSTRFAPALQKSRVLLVSADADRMEVVREALGSRFLVAGVNAPSRALVKARAFEPEVALIDAETGGGRSMIASLRGLLPELVIVLLRPPAAPERELGGSGVYRRQAIDEGADAVVAHDALAELPQVLDNATRRPLWSSARRLVGRLQGLLGANEGREGQGEGTRSGGFARLDGAPHAPSGGPLRGPLPGASPPPSGDARGPRATMAARPSWGPDLDDPSPGEAAGADDVFSSTLIGPMFAPPPRGKATVPGIPAMGHDDEGPGAAEAPASAPMGSWQWSTLTPPVPPTPPPLPPPPIWGAPIARPPSSRVGGPAELDISFEADARARTLPGFPALGDASGGDGPSANDDDDDRWEPPLAG